MFRNPARATNPAVVPPVVFTTSPSAIVSVPVPALSDSPRSEQLASEHHEPSSHDFV
jgi:hypothetical protein